MDDYTSNILNDSKNEWSILLINYITPHIIDGFKAIFNESIQLCESNDEIEKYLMTFQNLLSRIPKWNQSIVLAEQERIIKVCNCSYLEDLITCVHILQLKILSCVRVGNESKKISIDVPDITSFIHHIYINIARKLYSNIYLFEIDIQPLEQQRRNREFELMVQTCIMNTVRDKIPVETLLRQFIDETQEIEVTKVETVLNKNTNANVKELNTNQDNIPIKTNSFDSNNTIMNTNTNTMSNSIISTSNMNNVNTNFDKFDNINFNNLNNFDDKKQSISFNPNPSVLEIENISDLNKNMNDSFDLNSDLDSDLNLNSIKIENDPVSFSFEELDSTPVSLEFEEL